MIYIHHLMKIEYPNLQSFLAQYSSDEIVVVADEKHLLTKIGWKLDVQKFITP